jgi:Uma2 family endonuclease
MAVDPQPHRMTVEEYLELDRNDPDHRYEYYDGDIRMMAGGSLNHSTIKINVIAELKRTLRGTDCRAFDSDARVQLDAKHLVYPDATISCDPADRGSGDIVHAPRVIIEVLSPSTERYDRGRKSNLYRACPSIEEYVPITTTFPLVEVYRRAEPFWQFQSVSLGETFTLKSIGISIAVDAVYDDIEFPPDTSSENS